MLTIQSDLQKAIREDCLVVFAGAGTSIDLGLPSWKGLVLKVLTEIKEEDENYYHLEKLVEKDIITPLQTLELLQSNNHYRNVIIDTLASLNNLDGKRNFPLQEKIFKLSKKIITTNYDKAFENASEDQVVIDNDDKWQLAKIFSRDKFIWKIHGDLDSPANCVLFEDQYDKKYKEGAFLLGLQYLFIQKTILFIGFSLTDPYIERIIKTISGFYDFFNRKHYIITDNPGAIDSKYGGSIKTIRIKDHSEISFVLDELIKYKQNERKQNVDFLTTSPTLNLKLNRSYVNLIGRQNQLEELMKCIAEPTPITVIQGLPGVGKTSLAAEAAYICLGKSNIQIKNKMNFEFIVWIPLDDYTLEKNLFNCVLDEIGRQTGYLKITQTSDKSIKEGQAKELLDSKSVLLILDNFEVVKNEKLNSWIRTITSPSEVLITTQQTPPFPHTAYNLEGLNQIDSLEFMHQEARFQDVQLGKFGTDENLRKIHEATNGNPNFMNLAIGYIKMGALRLSELNQESEALKSIFREVYKKPWEKLSDNAKKILSIFPYFANKGAIHRDALLYISSFERDVFDNAITEIYDWNLLIVNIEEQYYTLHSSLIKFLEAEIRRYSPYNEDIVKSRFIEHYLDFVRNTIVRKEPNEQYWNTLVSDKMESLENQWTSILQALNWARESPLHKVNFKELVVLLIHYMDSRFYNYERINFVKDLIKICDDLNEVYLKALLHIDALGWTFVEEGNLIDAEKSILEGIKIIQDYEVDAGKADLINLGSAWLARVKIEEEPPNKEQAQKLIQAALNYDGKSWIKSRVYQAAGDINYKLTNYGKALEYYQKAKQESNKYGGEANDYRMNPRIGLAYLSNKNYEDSEATFNLVRNNSSIFINKLYGDYGLALVEYEKEINDSSKSKPERIEKACEKLKEIEREILKRSNTNILLKMIDQYKSENLDC